MLHIKRPVRTVAWVLLICLMATSGILPMSASAAPAFLLEENSVPANSNVSSVYYSASLGSLIIGNLENGTKLNVLSETKDFYRINCYDLNGYIPKSQVMKNDDGECYVACNTEAAGATNLKVYSAEEALSIRGEIRSFAMKFLGVRYVSGGTSPRGFDCSGLTQYVFNEMGISLERTVAGQLESGTIIEKEDLQCGDLVFFKNTTGWGHFASHVGIYIGNGQIIHAGNGGVGIGDLDHAYFVNHYMCARRVILSDLPQESAVPAIGINRNMNSSYWRESSQTEESGDFFYNPLASD